MTLPNTYEVALGDGRVLRYCLYGPADGVPVIFHGGSPSSRWKRPDVLDVMERSRLRLLVYDRPGYGGSTRSPGRTVADAADDVRVLADAYGWERFGVFGGSGGGPHALACAARLAERVTRCAVLSGIKPGGPPREEPAVREKTVEHSRSVMAQVAAGGPEFIGEPGPPARDDPLAMARLRATFADSIDGWVDDTLAFSRPWDFDPATITAPVAIWRGTNDTAVPADHATWMLGRIPGAVEHVYDGGHLPGPVTYSEIYDWLAG
ncbi:alpha/beta hydrolase [Paractinoplanes abujensis]|uniref:Pimeloyl-ACP methyl ester carboxylesterase n=1 Tax=Paractinoplanes abujensis TaxID=882441 RepID=A0A7W7G406_9ACTN|nr:alpha/beta hydrolase [Actinoplanes abujensis]MBB4695422.1 pimeloyl-ACP methyl ester carboxylesterase [Actinoplanes abujensis]GID23006.1 alpha/beta hydrolase [Actinoplanes abujensis]